MDLPLVFEPLFMERVWGGRRLETFLGKRLPPSVRIGEAWELVDREEAQSVVHEGPWRGLTLHELWTERRREIFGEGLPDTERFPLLCKILDAQRGVSRCRCIRRRRSRRARVASRRRRCGTCSMPLSTAISTRG
ncbi:MAG: type I phosphomannose isomerase catalytic subunit [Chthoniobacter sp.]